MRGEQPKKGAGACVRGRYDGHDGGLLLGSERDEDISLEMVELLLADLLIVKSAHCGPFGADFGCSIK